MACQSRDFQSATPQRQGRFLRWLQRRNGRVGSGKGGGSPLVTLARQLRTGGAKGTKAVSSLLQRRAVKIESDAAADCALAAGQVPRSPSRPPLVWPPSWRRYTMPTRRKCGATLDIEGMGTCGLLGGSATRPKRCRLFHVGCDGKVGERAAATALAVCVP